MLDLRERAVHKVPVTEPNSYLEVRVCGEDFGRHMGCRSEGGGCPPNPPGFFDGRSIFQR